MKKSLAVKISSRRGMIAIFVSLSFIFGTAALTLVQAASINKSVTVDIFDDGNLDVDLQIHNYNLHPNFAIFHGILKITSYYNTDITVNHMYIESWSGPKTWPDSVQYGSGEKEGILVPAGETVVKRLNLKAHHFDALIMDDTVYNYYAIDWTHGSNNYTKYGMHIENAAYWWDQLY